MTKTPKQIIEERIAEAKARDAIVEQQIKEAQAQDTVLDQEVDEDQQVLDALTTNQSPAPAPTPVDPPTPIDPPASPAPAPAAGSPPASTPPAPSPVDETLSPRRQFFERVMNLHYGLRSVSEAELAGYPQSFPADSTGPLTNHEEATGARGEIGILPDFSIPAVVSDDPRAAGFALAVANTSPLFRVHQQDSKLGGPIRFDLHPHTSLDASTTGDADVIADPSGTVEVNLAHIPHPLFVPLLDAVYRKDDATAKRLLEEMKYWTSRCFLGQPDHVRHFSDFFVNPQASVNQGRGAAWVLTWIAQTAAAMSLLDKNDPYLPSYVNAIEKNASFYKARFIDGTDDNSPYAPSNSPTGQFQNVIGVFEVSDIYQLGDGYARVGMFMEAFLIQSWGFVRGLVDAGTIVVSERAKADIHAVSDFGHSLIVAVCADPKGGGFDIRRMARFSIVVGKNNPDGSITKPKDFKEMAAWNESALPPLPSFDYDKSLRYHDSNNLHRNVGPIADGYAADIIPALAMAVRDNYAGAREAWERFKSLDDWRDSRQTLSPQFAIFPHGEYLDDPLPVASPAPEVKGSWEFLGNEGQDVTVPENSRVRYGANDIYVERVLGGTIHLGSAIFGDPVYGIVKHGELFVVDSAASSPPAAEPPASSPPSPPANTPPPTPVTDPPPLAPGAVLSVQDTGDAFFAALPVGRWVGMAASSTIRKAVAEFAPNYREYGNTGLTSITSAWSGAAFDAATGTFYITGGGHYDSNYNGMVSANVETGVFGQPITPTILSQADATEFVNYWKAHGGFLAWGQALPPTMSVPNYKPGAVHTYGSMWYVAPDKVILQGRVYNLTNDTVSTYPTVAGNPGNMGFKVGKMLVAANIIINTYWSVVQTDPDTMLETVGSFSIPPGLSGEVYSFNYATYGCAIGNTLYFIRAQSPDARFPAPVAWSLDVSTPQGDYPATILHPDSSWSADDMGSLQQNTMALDTDTNVLYIPSKDWGYFLTWEPLTGKCGKVSIDGPRPPQQINATFGRLQYYAKRKCLFMVNSIDEPIYYLRLS